MKLSTLKEDKKAFAKAASDINRSFALSGIAVVWIFSTFNKGVILIPFELKAPLILFFCSLFFDFIQFAYLSLTWTFKYRIYERKKSANEKFKVPRYIANISIVLFCIKLVCSLIGFAGVFMYFLNHTANH